MSSTNPIAENRKWELPSWSVTELSTRAKDHLVLIPVLNEGERIRRQLGKMEVYAEVADIAIVDGGSDDNALSLSFLRETSVRALAVKEGRGRLGAQLRIGLAWAMREGYSGVVLIDGNDKDNPAAIPRFVEKLTEGFDHVQGSRYIRGGVHANTPKTRYFGVRLFHAPVLSMAARFRYTDTTNGFRAYSRRLLLDERVQPFRDVFQGYELHYYLALQAARLGFRVTEIPVERVYPSGERTPTKIRGLRGNIEVLFALLATVFGAYKTGRRQN